jgi:hypothetical protein
MPIPSFVTVEKRDSRGQLVLGQDGKPIIGVLPSPMKEYVRTYWLVDDGVPPAGTPLILAPGAAGEVRYLIDQQGHFDWAYILGYYDTSIGHFMLQYYDDGRKRRLSNKPVHSATIIGSGRRAFRLPEPYLFNVGDSMRELKLYVRNISVPSAPPNTIRTILYGRRYYHNDAPPDVAEDMRRHYLDGWRCNAYFLVPKENDENGIPPVIAPGATQLFTFESDSAADTEISKIMTYPYNPNADFRWSERANQKFLSNAPIPAIAGFGNAEFPFNFVDGFLVTRQKQLFLQVTNLDQVNPLTLYVTAAGRRLEY